MTILQDALAALRSVRDMVTQDMADRDMDLACLRQVALLGLAAVEGPKRSRTDVPLATWGDPNGRRQKWVIHFEDQEMPLIVYDAALYGDEQAELLAREAFDRARVAWNCTLLTVAMDTGPANPMHRDDRIATIHQDDDGCAKGTT